MITKTFRLLLSASALLLPLELSAHHSPAMFDFSKQASLTGTVRLFQWTNPHSYIQLIVKGDDGTEQEWSLEMGANVYLYNLGWRPSSVKPGDTLTATVVLRFFYCPHSERTHSRFRTGTGIGLARGSQRRSRASRRAATTSSWAKMPRGAKRVASVSKPRARGRWTKKPTAGASR
jgi:hypothetical protein